MLHNKSPQIEWFKIAIIIYYPHCLYGSGIWGWLGWIVLVHRFLWDCNQNVTKTAVSGDWVRLENPLPSFPITGWQAMLAMGETLVPLQVGLSTWLGLPHNMVAWFQASDRGQVKLNLFYDLNFRSNIMTLLLHSICQDNPKLLTMKRWGKINSTSQWEENQSLAKKNRWDGINM